MAKHTSELTPKPGAAMPTIPPKWSPWVAPLALACALVAVVLATWSLLSSGPESTAADSDPAVEQGPPPITDQQIADAEARACLAFITVRNAVVQQTNADPSSDPAAIEAAAANARLSTAASGPYLRARLDPATPPPLAEAITAFSLLLEDVAMVQLAGVPNDEPIQAGRLANLDMAMTQLAETCN
ncbi:MAG: hypothetical protein AB7G47_06315 [Mycolicibacterium sp.]|uniref:hypothetical protein n=1 Tax=Mycolicibacterium sp. TaxID=2320850 RepID=UPI003D12E20D